MRALGLKVRIVFMALLLSGSIGVNADDPSHALMDHKYMVCEESKSLEGGIYGKGPFKRFGPPGVCAVDQWLVISKEDFKRLAMEWYGFDWSEEIPFWQQSGLTAAEDFNESQE